MPNTQMSESSPDRQRIEADICRSVGAAEDGVLDESQRKRLNQLLARDSLARSLYLDLIALRVLLLSTAGRSVRMEAEEKAIQLAYLLPAKCPGELENTGSELSLDHAADQGSGRWRSVLFATAAAIAVVVSLALLSPNREKPLVAGSPTADQRPASTDHELLVSVANVSSVSGGAVWRDPNDSLAVGATIREGQRIRLTQGEVELTYTSGVRLRLIGPAEYRPSPQGGVLSLGGLLASVPKAGRGFTVEIPNGKVIDLGTEFGVVVDDFGFSEVGVFKGNVELHPLSDSQQGDNGLGASKVELSEGDGLLWTKTSLSKIETDATRFTAATSLPDRDSDVPSANLNPLAAKNQAIASNTEWRVLGSAERTENGFTLRGEEGTPRTFLVSDRPFDPSNGPVTIECEVAIGPNGTTDSPSVAILTRSDEQRGGTAPPWHDMLATCVRCCFGADPQTGGGVLQAATKHESGWEPVDLSWRGFRKPAPGERYRLSMTDDGVNVTFTVALAGSSAVKKTVSCRSLFRGIGNYVAIEGPCSGSAVLENIRVIQEPAARRTPYFWPTIPDSTVDNTAQSDLTAQLAFENLLPVDSRLVVSESFDGNELDFKRWTTLGEATVTDGYLLLGKTAEGSTIDTWHDRPYLVTRDNFSPDGGQLTIVGKIEFPKNYLTGYGGSFAVMTRSSATYRKGDGWERSLLSYGVRSNFWPAGLGVMHSLELHSVSPEGPVSLIAASDYEVIPEVFTYLFQVIDYADDVQLTIVDAENPERRGVIAHKGVADWSKPRQVGFESTWGCPVKLDDIRIYQGRKASP